ncbi:MAG: four helix bundle protein [Arcicella sp.]|jgi:four helix bundle protein|nr:four helix bundle protein [Arcicella sp.]
MKTKDSIIRQKTFDFAIRVVNLYKYIVTDKKEYVLSKQLLRSGTSIGANVNEALYGQSKRDFISKLHISIKEASETKYWLELLNATGYLDEKEYNSIANDNVEILKILTSIIKTSKQNLDNEN